MINLILCIIIYMINLILCKVNEACLAANNSKVPEQFPRIYLCQIDVSYYRMIRIVQPIIVYWLY